MGGFWTGALIGWIVGSVGTACLLALVLDADAVRARRHPPFEDREPAGDE